MPYQIKESGDKFQVVKGDEVLGTHDTREKAESQVAALYAEEGKKSGARNNRRDKITIRTIREQAAAILELTRDLEPDEEIAEQDEMSESEAENLKSLLGDNTLNLSYVKAFRPDLADDFFAVKKVGVDTIRHPVFIWGNPEKTDLDREFFTRESDFWDSVLGKSARPLTWDHAQDETFTADPLIGKTVEWEDDEFARWAISNLDKSHRYRKAIDRLIDSKSLGSASVATPVLGASSDSAPQYVERVRMGKSTWLKRWPWFATALTVSPCEPRMVDGIAGVQFFKSLGISLPDAPGAARELLQLKTRFLKLKIGA